jgi:mannose/fructose/N-acetylgalactosamine-specific phosphotransferase system component IIC
MTGWLMVAVWGGLVGLDGTSFPQAMFSRPLIAGTVTGLLVGRPVEGAVAGFLVEVFALTTLPIGAAQYPEAGTATVAATSAYLAATPPGLHSGYLVLALLFALGWERVTALTVVAHRRATGRMLIRTHAVDAAKLERRHMAAMAMDFLRGAVVSLTGGLLGFGALWLLGPLWGLSPAVTAAILAAIGAGMVATAIPLFGGLRARRMAVVGGVALGIVVALVLQ